MAAGPTGQDELLEWRQAGIQRIEGGFERLHPRIVDDARGRHRELGADVEQRVLRVDEGFTNCIRERIGEDDPEIGVQLVQIPHRRDPGRVLGQTAPVGEAGGAAVAGARVDA